MQQLVLEYSRIPAVRISFPGVATVLVAHLGALAGLAAIALAPALPEMPPLMVQILPVQSSAASVLPLPAVPAAPRQSRLPEMSPRPQQRLPETAQTVGANPAAAAEAAPSPHTAPSVVPGDATVSAPRFDAAYLENPAPAYPALARRLGEEGKVWLRVYVEANGSPSRIEVKKSSGSPRLDQAAEQAVWRWKFIPAKRGSEALAAWVVVPISFDLRG